jgi:hypothetical protein
MKNKLILTIIFALAGVLATAQNVVITPPEAHIEPGESVTLTASGALYYTWSPATALSTTEGPVTVASPLVTTTYTCSGYGLGAENVVNSNFNQGNVGFTSDYQYNSNLWNEGTYYVDHDASLHHENFFGTGHGDGGNFMIVNGSTTPQTNVWTEQITVRPNTYYAFSTWVCTLAGQANEVALLQFCINGVQIGEIFSAPPERYVWEQFYELWYSGNATSATITILNQNTVGSGNDFGLDDISFCELVVLGEPECTVYVGTMSATATADATDFCIGGSTTLHALPAGGSGSYTYSWTPASTLDDPQAQHPVATPTETTTYTCLIDDGLTTQEVSVTIVVHPNEVTAVDATICEGDTYDFFGEALSEAGEYTHHLENQYGCDSLIRLTLSIDDYQTAPVLYQYECYEYGSQPEWYWDKTGITYHEDTVDEILLDDPTGGCPILHRLDLKFHEEYYHEQNKVACNEYYWPVNGVTYTENQDNVVVTFQNTFGDKVCDSTYVLHLEINSYETVELESNDCDFVVWGNDTITASGVYERTYTNQQGCDSIVTMHVNLGFTPRPTEIQPVNYGSHWVVTASEFQINAYDYIVEDLNPDNIWDTVIWSCDEAPHWMVEPYGDKGRYCRLFVLNYINDTIWLKAKIYNSCTGEGVTQRYWLVCSFYGIEDGTSGSAAFNVVPNPNNGQMTLDFEHLTGKVDLKVYDMRGAQIDRVQYYNGADGNLMQYDMQGRPNGIYLFVATAKEGTAVQKVIIQR